MIEWSIFNEIFTVAFNLLYFLIIIGTIMIVVLDNRNPVKTMAWVLVLFSFRLSDLSSISFWSEHT